MIFHVSSVYPPKLGGLEKVVQNLAKTQKQMGQDVSVITSNQGITDGEISNDGFPVLRLKSFVVANTTIIPTLPFKLLRIKRNDTAHVHIVQAFTPEMVWLASKVKHFSYVVHIHLDTTPSGLAGFLLRPYKRLILKRVLRAAKFVVVFTDDQKADVIQKYGLDPSRIKVIPNGVDSKFYYDELRTIHKKPRLLFVGRLNFQKNIQQLLHALDGVSDQFETTIIGDGELGPELKELTNSLGLKNVTFAGRKEGEELLNYYKAADIFVLPSEREGMPLVLLEAMAMGLPVVATNVTGSRDVIKDGENGLLVPYDDADAFREALLKIESDSKSYEAMCRASRKMAEQYSWGKVASKVDRTYKEQPKVQELKVVPQTIKTAPAIDLTLWPLVLPLLIVANLAYLPKEFFGWVITLSFFLLVPGYLLLSCLGHGIKSRWEIMSFSLGLSLLLLMVSGLALNSLHVFGLARPFTTLNIFATLDLVALILLGLNRKKHIKLPSLHIRPSAEQIAVSSALTMLPPLAIGGAIRLNNGVSNVLTMILFAAIPVLFIYLITHKKLKSLYPYAVLMFGMAVLLSTSLRGWSITGHDIQHEFRVFQITSSNSFWNIHNPAGDPYNACLSITILPTIIARITSVSAPYVYKAVFQVIFAFGLVPIFSLLKRLSGTQKALIGALIFISFPPFLEDMPYLNRQEIAFVFFALLVLVTFMNMARKPKTVLTILCLLGVTLSHYSSGYVTLGILVLSWLFYKLLTHRRSNWQPFILPALSLPVILAALLFTFLWNAQVTTTTSGLRKTLTETAEGLWGNSPTQADGVSYSILSPSTVSPTVVLAKYAGKSANQVQYVPSPNLPITAAGRAVSHIISAATLNSFLRSFSAKILQILLILGVIIYFFKQKAKLSAKETYFYALTLACLTLLVLITILPQLSEDYSVTRLFQQTLVITAFVIVSALEFLLGFLGRIKIHVLALFFALLFLELSGFMPQALGGYVAQLSLNNSGQYYDLYYVHSGEVLASSWLLQHRGHQSVAADSYAAIRFPQYPFEKAHPESPVFAPYAQYLYQDYANKNQRLYAGFINGDVIEYSYTSPVATNGNLVYASQDSSIYHQK